MYTHTWDNDTYQKPDLKWKKKYLENHWIDMLIDTSIMYAIRFLN